LDGFSGFPNVAAHFKPVQKRPSFKKLLSTNLLLLAILYLLGTSSFAAANSFDDGALRTSPATMFRR
jgi:hypothetical protein